MRLRAVVSIRLTICIALTTALCGHIFAQAPQPCSQHGPTIAVGGTLGFDSFRDPASSAKLRATCKVQLYIHSYIWKLLDDATKRAIVHTFAGTGPQVLEVGMGGPSTWSTDYQPNLGVFGVHADQVHVNGTERATLAKWKLYVDAAHAVGIRVASPVWAPNSNQWKTDDFNSQRWDDIKAKAIYGGGVTVDSPPNVFLNSPAGYSHFVEQEIRWARSKGLQATLIISPSITGKTMLAETQRALRKLQQDDALPTFYIVENYHPLPADPKYVNWVGPESNPYSIAAVARWVAEQAPVAQEHREAKVR
jgi:hypothetical protein